MHDGKMVALPLEALESLLSIATGVTIAGLEDEVMDSLPEEAKLAALAQDFLEDFGPGEETVVYTLDQATAMIALVSTVAVVNVMDPELADQLEKYAKKIDEADAEADAKEISL